MFELTGQQLIIIDFIGGIDSRLDPLPNKAVLMRGMIFGPVTIIFDPLDGVCLWRASDRPYLSCTTIEGLGRAKAAELTP